MFRARGLDSRFRRVFIGLAGLLAMGPPVCALAQSADAAALGAPRWLDAGAIETRDGYATIRWAAPPGAVPALYRLTETRDGVEKVAYVEGERLRVYRAVAGRYELRLAACIRDAAGRPACGAPSQPLVLQVGDDWKGAASRRADAAALEPAGPSAADSVAGGPDQLRPGSWFNPERDGHGYSFFWANRLALPESNITHGLAYDLLGYWYTYEARAATLESDPACLDDPALDCNWAYSDFRPLAARLWLVRETDQRYRGAIYVTRNGQEAQVGVAYLTFGAGNTTATIDWSVDFRWQRHAAIDPLYLLVGSDAVSTDDATHYSGIWGAADGGGPVLVEALGYQSESVELVFEDALGDPGWLQAVTIGEPQAGETDLCFYYVSEGYAPDASGSVGFVESGCGTNAPADAQNRNGQRAFTGFEQARAWASFDLPEGRGGVRLGSPEAPATLVKRAGFNRIRHRAPDGGCVVNTTTPACELTLTWFTDGDYPRATPFLLDRVSGARTAVAAAGGIAVEDFPLSIAAPGEYRFELRMGDTPDSALMARSADFAVRDTGVATPREAAVRWVDAASRSLAVNWTHPDPESVNWFEVEETRPAGAGVTVHSIPSGSAQRLPFDYLDGPYGLHAYRLRACTDLAPVTRCSDWTPTFPWYVDRPGQPPPGIAHPWGAHATGTLYTDVLHDYAMGYHFRPETDGFVRELGGLFDGAKIVRLFERASGDLLAETRVSGDNEWRYTPIEPVAVSAGAEYTVAVYLEGSGSSYLVGYPLPVAHDGVAVLGSTHALTRYDPDAIPVNLNLGVMYGQADIGFTPAELPPGVDPGTPANPEPAPPPAPKPDFTVDDASASVGSTAGEFRVDERGAANFRVPLLTAPGSGGLAPKLALRYDSQGPNEVAGVGWSIEGLSSVTRCPQTIEQDGLASSRGVTLGGEDRFCLDGQRLMVVAGEYGADGAEYRTEIDGFARIRSFGRAGNGPAWFEVQHGDGSVSRYGATADSRIEARLPGDAATVLTWAIDRRQDAAGNYIGYRYAERAEGPVEAVLDRVQYTGNARAGTLPYAELRFHYQAGRIDVPDSYIRGATIARSHLLTRVDSVAKATSSDATMAPLRSWFLAYGQDGFGRRVLESLTECSDPSARHCLAPTTFDWLKSEHEVAPAGVAVDRIFPRDFRGLEIADVNGDGFSDLVLVEGKNRFSFRVALARAQGGFTALPEEYALPAVDEERRPVRLQVVDLDADGLQDVVYPRRGATGVDWVARLSDGGRFGAEIVVAPGCCELLEPRVASMVDFNGDGLADLMTERGNVPGTAQGDLVILLNALPATGAPGFAAPRAVRVVYDAELFPQDPVSGWYLLDDAPGFREVAARTPGEVQVFDYNGDGRVDLLARIDRRYVLCDTSCNATAAATRAVAGGQSLDFDPDATANDAGVVTVSFYIVFESDGADRYVQGHVVATDAANGCDVPVACEPWRHLPAVRQLQSVDVNGDGLADLAWRDRRHDWFYRLNTGAGFGPTRLVARPADAGLSERARFVDLTGDGYPDFLYPEAMNQDLARWTVHVNDLGRGFAAAMASTARHGHGDRGDVSLLHDFNGDGMLDNLFLEFRKGVVDPKGTQFFPGRNFLSGAGHEAANVIRAIRGAYGAETRLQYASLTDPGVHTVQRLHGAARWGRGSPVFDLVMPAYVVRAVERDAPTFSNDRAFTRTRYHYAGARAQSGGRGFLGFAEIVSWDEDTGIRTNTRYRQDFPFTGAVADVSRFLAGAADAAGLLGGNGGVPSWPPVDADTAPPPAQDTARRIGFTATRWLSAETVAGSGARSRLEAGVLERSWTPGGSPLRKSLSGHVFDGFGRIAESVERTWPGEGGAPFLAVTTRNRFAAADEPRWILGRLEQVTVEHRRAGQLPVTRTSAFGYDPASGRRNREVVEPGDAELEVTTVHAIDAFGNRVATTVTAAGMAPRVSRMAFDGFGRFAVREINHYGQVHMEVHRWNAHGTPLEVSDIDGVRTHSASDPMGRVFVNWTETGAWDRTVRRNGAGEVCPAGAAYHLLTQSGGKPDRVTCMGPLGRTTREAWRGFDGRWVAKDAYFDRQGRPERASAPYFLGEARYWNVTRYDELGRVTAVDSAAGDDLGRSYGEAAAGFCGVDDPRAVRTVDAQGRQKIEVVNVLGEIETVFDDLCGEISYRYDSIGNLLQVTGVDGATVRMRYDRGGRKVATEDPDKGNWRYAWNALGELSRQLDARGQALDYEYDELGRVVRRLELSGVDGLDDTAYTVENVETTTWQNAASSATTGKAQPVRVTYRGGDGALVHQRSYAYDGFGRSAQVETLIGEARFSEATTYDAFGRVFQQFDASGDFRGIRYLYNGHGYRSGLREAREGPDGVVYQSVQAMDAHGHVTAATLGNGVEAFAEYEPASGRLLRLNAYDAMGAELQDVEYLFDVLGNLVQRRDRSDGRDLGEDFVYDRLDRLVEVRYDAPMTSLAPEPLQIRYDHAGNISWKSDVGSYSYGGGGAGPHAVTAAGGQTYAYDANGNQVAGDGRTLEYSVFDKVTRIERAGAETRFAYGIAHARIARIDENDVDGSRSTLYLGTVDYIETTDETLFKRRIGDAAVVDFHPATGASATRYLVRDHLGSVHNATTDSGLAADAVWMSFDAFGQRRSVDWAGPPDPASLAALNRLTGRGFTGHEHVDAMGLIHMNGRVYDPKLGRFLQADPLVQAPADGQALNRYSYALNNPLGYTDPSGYSFKRFIKRWGRLIAALVLSVVLPGSGGVLASSFGIGNVYAQAAITGFIAGAVASGTFKGAVIGAVVSLAVTGIIEAYASATQVEGLAKADDLMPTESEFKYLYGGNEPPAGLYQVEVRADGTFVDAGSIPTSDLASGDVIFTNGMKNGFRSAVQNGTTHLHQAGLLKDSYILNFNPTHGFFPDLLEASRDIVGAHTGLVHSQLARDLAQTVHQASLRGVSGLQLVGHSQGGAITASALRYAGKAGFSLRSLAGGGVSLHGAPVNAWMARTRLVDRAGPGVVSRAQFGDAVHVFGGLNVSNPLEVLISVYRTPALFSPDASVSPHSLPCGGSTSLVCAY